MIEYDGCNVMKYDGCNVIEANPTAAICRHAQSSLTPRLLACPI